MGLGAIAGAAGSIIGGGMNYLANRENNKANLNLYREQQQDNLSYFNMQNEYNHPSAQRSRLQEAGLNPALMYGSGSAGGASGQASPIQKADIGVANQKSPNFDFVAQSLNQYYDVKIKQAQHDNLRQQTTTSDELAALHTANRMLRTQQEQREGIGAERDRQTLDYQVDGQRLKVKELKATINNKIAAKKGINANSNIKDLDYQLYSKLGITPNAPFWTKMQAKMLKNSSDDKKINSILGTHLLGQIMGKGKYTKRKFGQNGQTTIQF